MSTGTRVSGCSFLPLSIIDPGVHSSMPAPTDRRPVSFAIPHLDRKSATFVFIVTLLAFVVESELAQYVQTTLQYRQPYFLFYVVHSSVSLIFPLHLLYLFATTAHSSSSLLKGLAIAISTHLSPGEKFEAFQFPVSKFLRLTLALTFGIAIPALLWFVSVSLASITDVTAIWNTNAFFAYVITVKLFKLQWEPKRLLAVVLATLGTFAVVYGGVTDSKKSPTNGKPSLSNKPPAPLLGNLLTLCASFACGLYTVLYKMYAALPSDPEVAAERHQYEQLPDDEQGLVSPECLDTTEAVYPPPFGLHPNLMTSLMGFFTFVIFWIPLPFLHWSGKEIFRPPSDMWTCLMIGSIGLTAMCFNAGYMVLLGVWGPIIVSVGSLLTIVLILIADVLFGPGLEVLTFWSLLGSGGIVLAFAVLSYDMLRKRT